MYNFGGVFILLAFQLLGALLFMGLSKVWFFALCFLGLRVSVHVKRFYGATPVVL